MPAWAIVGSHTRKPVVAAVMAAISHLRMRRVMISPPLSVDVPGSARIAGQIGGS
jgi:hypothetical protein